MKRPRILLLTFLLLWPLVAGLALFAYDGNAMASVLMFFGVPSLAIGLQLTRRALQKAALFSVLLAPPSIIVIDYIAHLTNQWVIPQSVLPWRLFTFVSLEVILWAILNVFVVVAFYVRFVERSSDSRLARPRFLRLVAWFIGVFCLFVVLYSLGSVGLHLPYFYLLFGIALILVPTCIELYRHPALLGRFVVTALYFFYLTFVYEVIALRMGWWQFPSTQYIGWVSVAGVRFPLEEFVFWLMLFSVAILSFYESFDDDNR